MADPKGNITAICAFDPDDVLRALECTEDDILLVSQTSGGVFVVEQTDPDKLKTLVHGDDSGGDPQALQVDANKSLVIAQRSGDEWEIKQQTPADLTVGLHGRISSAWQKLSMLWGFSDYLSEGLVDTNLSAGFNALDGTVVPSGEVWVITTGAIMYVGTSPTAIQIVPDVNSVACPCLYQASPTSAIWYCVNGTFILAEGDKFRARVDGATAGDDLYLRYNGYKMEVDL